MSPLYLQGGWAYHNRRALKKAGCRWDAERRVWIAPSEEAARYLRNTYEPTQKYLYSLTVYGDAGFRQEARLGKWAWYVRHADGRVEGSQEGCCDTVQGAEALSLLCGLRAGLERWPLWPHHRERAVFFRNDNLDVVHALQKPTALRRLAPIADILKICDTFSLTIDAKHVKGHQNPKRSVQAWLNNRVDEAANLRR